MLHLRVIAPVELQDRVIGALRSQPGVTHIVLHRNASLDPPGDGSPPTSPGECQRHRRRSQGARPAPQRAITLDVVDTVLSTAAYRAEKQADGDPGDAIVWEELVARTREESTLNMTFLLFLCLACMIAAVGVITDSPVTVVGAMVVGPEFGPLAALAVALVRRRMYLARRASIALLVGFPVAMAVTAAFVLSGEALGWITLRSTRELTDVDFIFQVGPLSVVVALLAGAAGMLSLVSAKSAALVGVFISVTTVPAAGFAVVAASVGDWDIAAESAAQLAVNLVGITLAGVLVLAVRRRHARLAGRLRGTRADVWPAQAILVVVGLRPMGIKVALEHRTSYTFDRLVEVHPHVVRLRPAPHSARRSRRTRWRSNPPTTSSTGSRTRSAISWPGWSFPAEPGT